MLGKTEYVIRDLMSHPLASSHISNIPEYFGYRFAVYFLTSPLIIFSLFLLILLLTLIIRYAQAARFHKRHILVS
jgi:hypothetical protein